MKILYKIKFFYTLFIVVLVSAIFMIPLSFLFRKNAHYIMYLSNLIIKFLIIYRVKVYGERDSNTNIFMINHSSTMDILSLESVRPNNMTWIAKKELFDIFWLGNILKNADMIPVQRANKSSLIKLIKDIKLKLQNNNDLQIAIFPEGTKNKNYKKLMPFKMGSKIIIEKFNFKVQPIVIINSKSIMDDHLKESKFFNNIIHIHYLESFFIDKNNKNWMDNIREIMQTKIDKEYSLLNNKKVDNK